MSKKDWGITLISLSIFLILLFFIPGYHTLYWAHPIIFIPFTIIGVVSALYGSYLFRVNIRKGIERNHVFYVILALFGGLAFLLGIFTGIIAIFVAFYIGFGTGDWGDSFSRFSDYNHDLRFLALQIFLFGLAVIFSIIGQFLIGIGHNKH